MKLRGATTVILLKRYYVEIGANGDRCLCNEEAGTRIPVSPSTGVWDLIDKILELQQVWQADGLCGEANQRRDMQISTNTRRAAE
jgi:hypothetical protein